MKSYIKQNLVLPDVSFLIVDTENKTNKELKEEVYKRVIKMVDTNKEAVTRELIIEDSIENRVKYALITKACKKEIRKIIRQFNFQIDQLVPAS